MKFFLLTLGLALGLGTVTLHAQDDTPYIFHTYSNLIQIPVLTLGHFHEVLPPATQMKFSVSIDSGPPFPAPHVRLEGDDPISLAILLDLSGDQSDIMSRMNEAIASLASHSLLAQDRVSIYAVDCHLVRTAADIPADAAQLKLAVEAALHSSLVHGTEKAHSDCNRSLHLWDALTYVTSQLVKQPGRRVVLAVTDGHDQGSSHPWKDLREYANSAGVAIFGLAEVPYRTVVLDSDVPRYKGYEDEFAMLCEYSGGIVHRAFQRDLPERLADFIAGLRNRYIVEFTRPDNLTEGPHDFLVTLPDQRYFIRSAGISLPIADQEVLADPATLPSDPADAPAVGNRRILVPSH